MRGKLLTDEEAVARVMAEHRTLGQRIREILRRIGEELRKIFGKSEPTLERAQALWDRAYEQATRNAENGQKNTAREGAEARYSVNSAFAREVKEWFDNGAPEGERFILGETGAVLQGLGAIENDIYMNGDKIKEILFVDHKEMSLDTIQRIPEILDEPVLVLKSRNVGRGKSANTRLVIFGAVKADNGKPILAVLDLRPVEGHLVIDDMQKITSAYTKTTTPTEFIRNSEILYADKKRSPSLLKTIGFHAPIELQQSGSIGSISYRRQFVNIQGEPFSSVVRESEKENLSVKEHSAEKVKGKFSLAQTQKVFPRTKGRSFRGYSSKSALSRAGYAMFTDDFVQAYDYTSSGRALWTVDNTKLQDVQELIPTIEKALLQGYENGTLPAEMDYLDEDGLRKLAGEADPEDIVMSAGLWDNEAALTYLFDAGVFDDVPGVKTRDGAVVFDETLIEKDNPDWYTEDSETRNAGRYDLTDEEARKATEWEQAQMDKAREVLDDPESTESDRMVAELVMQRTEERIGERTQRESRNAKEALAILCVCAYNKNRLQETRCFYALSLLRLSRKQGH